MSYHDLPVFKRSLSARRSEGKTISRIDTQDLGGGTFLGGSYHANDWNPHPDLELGMQIMKRCIELHPSLTSGRGLEGLSAVRHGVGLRPARTGGPRCEAEEVKGTKVIHNYGHGGSGYQASYGCAYLVVKLVQQIVGSSSDCKIG